MEDSYVAIFHGPRRGGKTLSMVVQAIVDMALKGRRVWSALPIGPVEVDGKIYETLPIDYDDLLRQDSKFENGVICWDEAAMWAYARNSPTVFNKTLALILTLIGKMELSLYMTVQFLSLLEKSARIQMDALVMCTDLSFKYKQLERGSTIGQLLQDISGRFTGETYEWSGDVYQRTLHGKTFWPYYDTKKFWYLKDTLQKKTREELYGATEDQGYYEEVESQNLLLLRHIGEQFISDEREIVSPPEFFRAARSAGCTLSQYRIEQLLPMIGIEMGGAKGHPVYKLDTALVGAAYGSN